MTLRRKRLLRPASNLLYIQGIILLYYYVCYLSCICCKLVENQNQVTTGVALFLNLFWYVLTTFVPISGPTTDVGVPEEFFVFRCGSTLSTELGVLLSFGGISLLALEEEFTLD